MAFHETLNYEKGAAPLYAQIEEILKKKIESGEYKKGEIIPGEKELMEQFGVSRVTVRQAMGALANGGYVKSQRGVGTEVIFDKINEHIKGVISFTDEMKLHNITMETTYCTMEKLHANQQIAAQLSVEEGENCYCLTRVRCVDGSPLVYTKTYLVAKADYPTDSTYYKESLYKYL
nr:GntR family transcriptional regulator [Acetatifactor sp.]